MTNNLQLGIASTALDAEALGAAFERAAKMGAEGLELSYCTEKDTKALWEGDHPKQLGDLARSCGVAIPSLGLSALTRKTSLTGAAKQIESGKKLIRQALTVAAEVNAKVLLLPFFGKNTIETEDALTRAADALLDLVEPAEDAGVILGIESTINFSQQRFLLDHLGNTGYVRIYPDTASALVRKLDLPTGLRDLGAEAIAQIHFRDVRITEANPPDYEVALGDGDVDFRAAAQTMRAIGYEGWVILETAPTDDPLAAGKKNLQFARELLNAAL